MADPIWKITRTGALVNLRRLHVSDICWQDLIAGMCQARYSGAAVVGGEAYTVLTHSVLLHDHFHRQGQEARARYALVHDAPEAYYGDIHGPLKRAPELAELGALLEAIDRTVLAFVGGASVGALLDVPIADKRLCLGELKYFWPNFDLMFASTGLADAVVPIPVSIPAWDRSAQRHNWLVRAQRFWPELRYLSAEGI